MKGVLIASTMLVLCSTYGTNPNATLDPKAVLAKYKRECAGRKKLSQSCKEQQRLVEGVYYRSFRRLTASRQKGAVDRKYMVRAARADFLALRELGLWTLANEGSERGRSESVLPKAGFLKPEEVELYAAELNSPYPALRKVAWDALLIDRFKKQRTVDETKWGVDRDYRKQFGTYWHGAPAGLSADREPHADRLRAKPYPHAKIQYYALGKGGAVWLTSDSLEKVSRYYEKQGMKSIHAGEYMSRLQKFQKAKMSELVKKMEGGGDPAALQAEMKSLEELTKRLSPGYLFAEKNPRDQLHLGREITAGNVSMIEYQVVIWRSDALKKTGIAIDFKDRRK